MHPTTEPSTRTVEDYLGVDDAELLALLNEHGRNINTLRADQYEPAGPDPDEAELVPLREGWLSVNVNKHEDLVGRLVDDPVKMTGASKPFVFTNPEIEGLEGWIAVNLDVDFSLKRWLRVLRHPQRESYAVAVYDQGNPEPTLALVGTYPYAALSEGEQPKLAFVEPHPQVADKARAQLIPVNAASTGFQPITLAEGPAGGVKVLPCSVRRFIKVGHGVPSARAWQIVDTADANPHPISIPEFVPDPDLIDVGILDGEPVFIHATNDRGHWRIDANELRYGEVRQGWRLAAGKGTVHQLSGGTGHALVRVSTSDSHRETEHLHILTLTGFSSMASRPVVNSAGQFDLSLSICAEGVGFVAVEMVTGAPPLNWYFDPAGHILNPGIERVTDTESARDHCVSPDGYEFAIEMRWRGGSHFRGPVIFMVYGAYGIDLELDTDPEQRYWLDRGYAVAVARVRGGGGPTRHQAGTRHRREGSLADTVAAARWLRSGHGSVTATQLCVVGASAGGFLAASLLAEVPNLVDAGVVVNGYVDPLHALLRLPTRTGQADRDEWGDPEHSPRDREALHRLSPFRKLTKPTPPSLVIVSGRDARVNPRLGLAWAMRLRDVGSEATLWFDPDGTHDRWGIDLNPNALIDWVDGALDRSTPLERGGEA